MGLSFSEVCSFCVGELLALAACMTASVEASGSPASPTRMATPQEVDQHFGIVGSV